MKTTHKTENSKDSIIHLFCLCHYTASKLKYCTLFLYPCKGYDNFGQKFSTHLKALPIPLNIYSESASTWEFILICPSVCSSVSYNAILSLHFRTIWMKLGRHASYWCRLFISRNEPYQTDISYSCRTYYRRFLLFSR